MKYSYMPLVDTKLKSKCEVFGSDYFIDSNERQLKFRNQYRETFIFAPYKAIVFSWLMWMMLGILIGRFIL